jgi:uncharacterized protein
MGASKAGTESYFVNSPLSVPPVILGRTGWRISPVGFESGHLKESDPEHNLALKQALTSGCNLIDTSPSYSNGGAERLIGRVLKELFQNKSLKREHIVLVTKADYDQGFSPALLEDQLTRSLLRLNLEQIDVLLLKNPEYFFKTNKNHSDYYRLIKNAFTHLEEEVARGRIQYYGISSNTFSEPKDSPEYTSLETTLELANELSQTNHFAVIQFPFNLFEPGAAIVENNSGKTLCELALLKNLGTISNRPLATLAGNQLVSLTDSPLTAPSLHEGENPEQKLQETLERATDIESHYSGQELVPARQIAWGHILHKNTSKITNIGSWKEILANQILPTLRSAHHTLKEKNHAPMWISAHQAACTELFEAFTTYLEWKSAKRSEHLAKSLLKDCPDLASSRTLAQKVIRIYRSTPGIQCVLVGMSKPDYVRDTLTLAPKLTPEQTFECLAAAH